MAKLKVDEIEATSTNSDVNVVTKGSTGALEIKGNSSNEGTLQLNCSAQSHGVKLKAPSNNADLGYTMTLPDNQIAASKILKVKSVTNNNAQLEYADVPPNDLTSTPLNADNITSGTIPSASFPQLPATTGLGLELVSAQEVTAANINSVTFTGLEDNTAYHIKICGVQCSNYDYFNFYGYPLDASNTHIQNLMQGVHIRHQDNISGARANDAPTNYIVVSQNISWYSRAYDGPFSADIDLYTGNSNAVNVNGLTRNNFWGNLNGGSHGTNPSTYGSTHEHYFTWSSTASYALTRVHGLRFGFDYSAAYIKPNAGAKFLLYKYKE